MNTQLISRLSKAGLVLAALITFSVSNPLSAQGYGPGGGGCNPNYGNNQGYGYGNGYNNGYGNGYNNGYGNGQNYGYNNGYSQGYPNQYGQYGPPVVYQNRPPVVIVPAPLPPVIISPPVIIQRPRYIVPGPRFGGGGNYGYRQRGFGGYGRRW